MKTEKTEKFSCISSKIMHCTLVTCSYDTEAILVCPLKSKLSIILTNETLKID